MGASAQPWVTDSAAPPSTSSPSGPPADTRSPVVQAAAAGGVSSPVSKPAGGAPGPQSGRRPASTVATVVLPPRLTWSTPAGQGEAPGPQPAADELLVGRLEDADAEEGATGPRVAWPGRRPMSPSSA